MDCSEKTLKNVWCVSLNCLRCIMWPCSGAQSILTVFSPMNVQCGKMCGQSSGRADFHLYIFELYHCNSRAETRAWRQRDLEEHKSPEICWNLGEALTSTIYSYFYLEGQGGWRLNYKSNAHLFQKVQKRERSRKKKSLRALSSRHLRVWPEECIRE